MNYDKFVATLENLNIKLFDYQKRKLYYQLNNNIMSGGRNCIKCFLDCNNKKYIIDQYNKNNYKINFINKNYKNIN